ncbi:MAG: cyclopropane-fatty-acyl-phospholipid synthase family protein [Anaerolineae bacterium]
MSHTAVLTTTDPRVQHVMSLVEHLFPSPRTFSLCFWDGSELAADRENYLRLTFHHPGTLRRILTPPIGLSVGEAYIYGDLDIDGDLFEAFTLMNALSDRAYSIGDTVHLLREWLALPHEPSERMNVRGPAQLHGALHSRERDRAAIQYHYNAGNEFYGLWLDARRQYSCGFFPTGTEDLATAQELKLEQICRKLRLKPGERLLDIGCGWGGLALYAAEKYGAEVVGVTLSDRQAEYAQKQVKDSPYRDQIDIRLVDYRDLTDQPFDKLVSIGMFEHVGRSHLPEYFAQANCLLKPGGLFLNHGIALWPGSKYGRKPPTAMQKFVQKRIIDVSAFVGAYIFPDGELEPVSEVNLIAERHGFEVRDVENWREHYALTLRHWVRRLEAHQAEAVGLTDEVTYRTWRLYMAVSAYSFTTGLFNVNQSLLAKPLNGKAIIPLSRADIYA